MTDSGLLALTQWLSPAFPVGGFAYSHGLEHAISTGAVGDADTLEVWLTDVIARGSGRADAILLCAAMAMDADWRALDALGRALAPSRERLAETLAQGTAFTEATNALHGTSHPPVLLPVAVGRAARALDLPPAQVAGFYLQSFASNLVAGAVRFVPLGQSAGQAALAALHPLILDVARRAATASVDDITSAAPGADLAAMAHETMDVRIFKT
ncbi:MAG: urease accessory UreF family protein [Pseudomonadota bacterium]